MLDTVDGVTGNLSSCNSLIIPRDNHMWWLSHGFVLVRNTGSVALTVTAHMNATAAIVLDMDDDTKGLSELASIMRTSADRLLENTNVEATIVPKVSYGPSLSSAYQSRMTAAGIHGPVDVAKSQVPTIHNNSVAGTFDRGVHAVKSFISEAANEVFSHVKKAASTIWGDIKGTAGSLIKDAWDGFTLGQA